MAGNSQKKRNVQIQMVYVGDQMGISPSINFINLILP